MLTLPTDWRLFHAGAVALDLFRQVPQFPLQRDFARHLIGADLELAIAEIFRHKHPPLLVEAVPDFSWRIRNFSWVYLPDIDNRALAKAIELASHLVRVTLIVLPKHDEIFWRACQPILKNRTPPIQSLDSLISLRVLFTSIALDHTHDRVVLDLLRRYNRRVLDTACDDAILVDIPSDHD